MLLFIYQVTKGKHAWTDMVEVVAQQMKDSSAAVLENEKFL